MMLKHTRRLTIVAHTKSQLRINVKTLMGKQHNKAEHKKRRKAYIKRKKVLAKVKPQKKA